MEDKDLFNKASDIVSKIIKKKDELFSEPTGKYGIPNIEMMKYAIPDIDKKNYCIIQSSKDDPNIEKYAIPNEPDEEAE